MKPAIQSIRSFQEIEFDGWPQKSLVIFDIDETLITPTDALLKPVGGNFQGWQRIQPEQFEHYLSIVLGSANYTLVDETIPTLLGALKRRGIFTMGLTACSTRCVGVIPSMTRWRCDQLKRLGINFSSCFTEEYIFSELVDVTAHPPLFKNGILFTGDLQHPEKSSKGLLLSAFLDRVNWNPEQIVFIDDHLKHLEAVRQMLDQRDIPFLGYEIDRPNPMLNERIAELQIQTLLESGNWISDSQAIHLIFPDRHI